MIVDPKRKMLISAFTHETKEASLHKGEHVMHLSELCNLSVFFITALIFKHLISTFSFFWAENSLQKYPFPQNLFVGSLP
jgi:hypothetical protein